jgi:hypothetical protein
MGQQQELPMTASPRRPARLPEPVAEHGIPRPPRGVRLGARVLLSIPETDAGIELRLSGVDSRGAWFLTVPPTLDLPLGVPATLYIGEGQTMQCFHSRIARLSRRDGLPGTVVLEAPNRPAAVPAAVPEEIDLQRRITVEHIPALRAVARPPGRSRPVTGEVVQLGAEAAVVHLRHPPKGRRLTLSLDPSEDFLQAKARDLERSRPGTTHTLWRLQKVYAVYFAGIETLLLDDPEDVPQIETDDGPRWVCVVEFEDPHVGCAELVRFHTELREQDEQTEERVRQTRDALWRQALRSA